MITVKTSETARRYEREIIFTSRNGRTAEERFAAWLEIHSQQSAGFPTPYEADNGQKGVIYLPNH